MEKTKISYLELLRIIACFFVIVNHTDMDVFGNHFSSEPIWWVSIAYFFLCKTAVPIFLMITGALMLGKKDSPKKYVSRILRLVLVIIIFSFVNYCYWSIKLGTQIDVLEFLVFIYGHASTNAYWYLYLYLGILIMMPFFQTLGMNLEKGELQLLIGLSVVFLGVYSLALHYNSNLMLQSDFGMVFFPVYVGLLFFGYYLATYVEVKKQYALISGILLIVLIAAEVLLTYLEIQRIPENLLFLDDRNGIFTTTSAALIFYLAKCLQEVKLREGFWKVIRLIGSACFGIYLLSDLLLDMFHIWYERLCYHMNQMLAVVVFELFIFGLGFLLTMGLKKIPGVKKLI